MEECIYYTQAGYGCCVSGIGMLCWGFDARSLLVLHSVCMLGKSFCA
jgi:hypothetical protein